MFLILVGFGTFPFTLSSLSKYLMTGTFQRCYKEYKIDSRIKIWKVMLCFSEVDETEWKPS
jgi:hypothetical protein